MTWQNVLYMHDCLSCARVVSCVPLLCFHLTLLLSPLPAIVSDCVHGGDCPLSLTCGEMLVKLYVFDILTLWYVHVYVLLIHTHFRNSCKLPFSLIVIFVPSVSPGDISAPLFLPLFSLNLFSDFSACAVSGDYSLPRGVCGWCGAGNASCSLHNAH